MYYRNAQSALVVYDLTKASSLVKAKHWVAELQRQASPGIVIALVGNKQDLTSQATGLEGSMGGMSLAASAEDDDDEEAEEGDSRQISTQEAKTYADEEGLLFFETSAKTGLNVQEVFTAIANAIPEATLKTRGPGATAAGGRGASGADSSVDRAVNLSAGDEVAKDGCAC